MKCIGSTQYLKQRYGQGYTIMIKLFTNNPDADDALFAFKNAVNRTFSRCFIKDEHKVSLDLCCFKFVHKDLSSITLFLAV